MRKGASGSVHMDRTTRKSDSSWLWVVAGLGAALLVAALAMALINFARPAPSAEANAGPRPGQQAPEFGLRTLDGATVRLSQFRGQPVLINFWASWCPPCKAEMPDIEQAFQKYRAQGLVVLGVDQEEDPATVKQFLSDRGFSWTFLMDEDGHVGETYRASALPTSIFVDRQGTVRAVQVGQMDASLLETKLATILAK